MPPITTTAKTTMMRVFRAEIADAAPGAASPGTVLAVDARGIVVATGAGALRLVEVQAAGKKRMAAADWARGARLGAGDALGA